MPVRVSEAAPLPHQRLSGPHTHKRTRDIPRPDPGVDDPALFRLSAFRPSSRADCVRQLGHDAGDLRGVMGAGQTAEFEREDPCAVWSL